MLNSVWESVEQIRDQSPLVHCITNTVAANFAANAVIAVGGSPVMASEPSEVCEVTQIAQALTVNIGTCSPSLVNAIENATQKANELGLNWVLDPVGVAATQTRQTLCKRLVEECKPSVVRGNASEILAMAKCTNSFDDESMQIKTRGLDSTLSPEYVLPAAKKFALKYKLVVAISGERDIIIDGATGRIARVVNGSIKMTHVTATGCSLTAVLGCFLANSKDQVFEKTIHALSFYAAAGEYAAKAAKGTGSMHTLMLDWLSSMTKQEYLQIARAHIDLSLYLVTDPKLNLNRTSAQSVELALQSKLVSLVQLREKDCDSGEFYTRALEIQKVCQKYRVPLLINDRVDIALAINADGIHIGQSDLPVPIARKLLGPSKVIGLSVSTLDELKVANKYASMLDYIGVGPVYPTGTKLNAKADLGIEKLGAVLTNTELPAVAIGGINAGNAQRVLDVEGVEGIAVVTALTMAEDPSIAAQKLIKQI